MVDKKEKGYTFEEIRQKMVDYCVYQDRCHFEVEKKMQEFTLIPEAKDDIILYLLSHNFLNEERFSLQYSISKFNQKKWGKLKIKQALKQKHISGFLIEKGLNQIDEETYWLVLKQLAEKKWHTLKEESLLKKRKKLIQYLLQKGYESPLVYEVVSDFE